MTGHADRSPRLAGERGVGLIEFALVVPLLAFLIFGAIDLGRLAQFQNRMTNAVREGAAIAQISAGGAYVDSGCHGDRNVWDRVATQNPGLSKNAGFSVTVAKKETDPVTPGQFVYTEYTGCTVATGGVNIGPGDRVVITVTADVKPTGPLTAAFLGDTVHLSRHIEVVVQG